MLVQLTDAQHQMYLLVGGDGFHQNYSALEEAFAHMPSLQCDLSNEYSRVTTMEPASRGHNTTNALSPFNKLVGPTPQPQPLMKIS